MDTRALYYDDCHLQSFTATVTACIPAEDRWQITLDATAFFPEGGGQACDLGTLGAARVLDVQLRNDTVCHYCDRPLEVGSTVTGQIQWERRFDLMQQHSGEHILSGLIHKRFGYHNVGFHIGAQFMEIDFDGPISPEEIEQLEAEANRAVWENLPIDAYYPDEETLKTLSYRTKKQLQWPVRMVSVPGFDLCACCGVHVAFTGEIGIIKILSCVKFHQGVRLQLVCGQRAYRYLCRITEQNRQISQLFSAQPLETAEAAQKISRQLTEEKYRSTGLQRQLFDTIAAGYAGQGQVVHFQPDATAAQVRELADKIADRWGGLAAVFSGTDENGYAVCLIHKSQPVQDFAKAMTAALGGRGGGRDGAFQGTLRASRQEILKFFAGESA